MYLQHFGFHTQPFSQTPNTELFLGLAPHFEAIQTVMAALEMGEGIVKVTGEVGTGKTMVCRMLIDQLSDKVNLVYLPNPVLSGHELQMAIAREMGLKTYDSVSLVPQIQDRLIGMRQRGMRTVLLVDEAQALPLEAMETLRLFGNLETEQEKLLQIVLFGQPELDERIAQHELRQFRQRITFSCQLRPLTIEEGVAFIDSRLAKAGDGELQYLTTEQKKALWRGAGGIPRLINQLCHKAFLLAYMQQQKNVTNQHLFTAIHDTYDACKPLFKTPVLWGWRAS
ncbi:ExeA family protein [Vibrio vulnificus]|uniref:ExeA family protein n=1 Tax=Vibrio vulnificus TaxID=672 RepID=UPI000C79B2ED|nr:AAA family ATPase [Vibrio vulnificus]AUL96766.1 MSHA biogenesis protein MshM [Vibrio vulnificus]EHH0794226.1 AAA family ATPase [Vibrio vulnificus]EHH1225803.1 AAA family ATPase [Vibrio vulnificus]EHK9184933.1 ExeA family protein [Vibrio vulnificus]EHZ2754819.1 ExeA family protein [Vibrio vulnificus]